MLRTPLRLLPLALVALVAAACSSAPGDESVDLAEAQLGTNGRPVLPNWATPEEAEIESRTLAPDARASSSPPAAGYRVPAEYEPVSHVIMTWASNTPVLKGIASASTSAGAEVWMVGGPQSIAGVAADKYKALNLPFDSVWARDYGPVGYNEATGKVSIVDTTYRHHAVRLNDDAMSCALADRLGGDCRRTNLILDGGNYMTDGQGNVFVTRRIYDWNSSMTEERVDELLKAYLGATTVHKLPYAKNASGQPADGTGHIDMMAKLVAPCKAVVVQTNDEPFKAVTNTIADYLSNLACGDGTYEVTRVKGWLSGRTWYTYSNSLMVNKTVILPFYNDNAKNQEAVAAYKSALPDYNVVGVLSESTIVIGGSIHCITKEIPVAAKVDLPTPDGETDTDTAPNSER